MYLEAFWRVKGIVLYETADVKRAIAEAYGYLAGYDCNVETIATTTYEDLAAMIRLKLIILNYFIEQDF